jgi:hypothetical protein
VVLLIVWGAAVVLALVVLGAVGYGLAGAFGRLTREVEGAQRDIGPLLEQVQGVAADRSE